MTWSYECHQSLFFTIFYLCCSEFFHSLFWNSLFSPLDISTFAILTLQYFNVRYFDPFDIVTDKHISCSIFSISAIFNIFRIDNATIQSKSIWFFFEQINVRINNISRKSYSIQWSIENKKIEQLLFIYFHIRNGKISKYLPFYI